MRQFGKAQNSHFYFEGVSLEGNNSHRDLESVSCPAQLKSELAHGDPRSGEWVSHEQVSVGGGACTCPCTRSPGVVSLLFCFQIRIASDQGVFPDYTITSLSTY